MARRGWNPKFRTRSCCPSSLNTNAPGPLRLPPSWLWLLIWFGVQALSRWAGNKPGVAVSTEMWVAGVGFVLGLGGLLLARRYFGRTATLATNRIRLSLHDRPGQQAALETFTHALRLRAHAYLREEYAQVNPLGPIELQLHRLHWLHNLDVLSEPELRVLSTRLTGRLSQEPLKLMGMDLETPYLN